MRTKKLILLLFALFAMLPPATAAPEKDELKAYDGTESLQMKDFAMCDLLPVTGCCPLPAPVSARPDHDTPTGASHAFAVVGQTFRGRASSSSRVVLCRPHGGSIYMNHCLRL